MQDDLNLIPGERLLWSGSPERRPFFEIGDVLVALWGLVVCAIAVFWLAKSRRPETPVVTLFAIFAAPTGLAGLYLLLGRPIVRRIRLGSTCYAVTDRRIIERSTRPWAQEREAYLRDLAPPIVRVKDPETIGSVAFGQFPRITDGSMVLSSGWRGDRPKPFVLTEIGQARYVRDLIARAQSSLNLPSA